MELNKAQKVKLDRAQVFLEAILDWALLFEKDLEKWRKKEIIQPT